MLAHNSENRISLQEVKDHPWVKPDMSAAKTAKLGSGRDRLKTIAKSPAGKQVHALDFFGRKKQNQAKLA